MKLGHDTGSLTNHLYSRMTKGQPAPTVGMGATILCWTDRHAATIVDVFTHGKFTYVAVQQDIATRSDSNGMSDCQSYTCAPNPSAPRQFWRFRDGRWQGVRKNDQGRWVKTDGKGLRIGDRDEYYDFSF